LLVDGWWLMVDGWWLMVGGWWLMVDGWWFIVLWFRDRWSGFGGSDVHSNLWPWKKIPYTSTIAPGLPEEQFPRTRAGSVCTSLSRRLPISTARWLVW
jgi:hypothetical protein